MSRNDEGSKCIIHGCNGTMGLEKIENCSCHINPPCHACVDVRLTCSECGYDPEWEEDPEKTIFAVFFVDSHENDLFCGAFSTREKAQIYCDKMNLSRSSRHYRFEEVEIR